MSPSESRESAHGVGCRVRRKKPFSADLGTPASSAYAFIVIIGYRIFFLRPMLLRRTRSFIPIAVNIVPAVVLRSRATDKTCGKKSGVCVNRFALCDFSNFLKKFPPCGLVKK